jgi:hypothetical protein
MDGRVMNPFSKASRAKAQRRRVAVRAEAAGGGAIGVLIRLMHYTPLSRPPVQPEDMMCVAFANALRAATLDGTLRAVWLHPAQELCFGHKTGVRAAISRAMGMHVGVGDYLFLWDGGSGVLEAKHGRNSLSPGQRDFRDWCGAQGVRFGLFRSVDEGLALLRGWGVLG